MQKTLLTESRLQIVDLDKLYHMLKPCIGSLRILLHILCDSPNRREHYLSNEHFFEVSEFDFDF